MDRSSVFGTLAWHYTAWGFVAGLVAGAVYGTAYLELGVLFGGVIVGSQLLGGVCLGVLYGGIFGAIPGAATGFVSGMVLGTVTILFLYPVTDMKRYGRTISAMSMAVAAVGTLLILHGLLPYATDSYFVFLVVVPAFVAGAAALWTSRRICRGAARQFAPIGPFHPVNLPEKPNGADSGPTRNIRSV
jgi:hypothetical protein